MELNQSLTWIFKISVTNIMAFENVENQINHILTPGNNPEYNLRLKIFLG